MQDKGKSEFDKQVKLIFAAGILISVMALLLIILQLSNSDINSRINWETISLFVIALIPWLGIFVKKFELNKDGFSADFKSLGEEVRQLSNKVEEVQPIAEEAKQLAINSENKINDVENVANIARIAAFQGIGKQSVSKAMKPDDEVPVNKTFHEMEKEVFIEKGSSSSTKKPKSAIPKNPDDPNKGQFGGKSSMNNRVLKAKITKIKGDDFYRQITIVVESTEPGTYPLIGNVKFYLHPTFTNPVVTGKAKENKAVTELISYGAFTIGVECDNGSTRLELDLAEMDDGVDQFYKR